MCERESVYVCESNTTPCSPTDFKLVTPDPVVVFSPGEKESVCVCERESERAYMCVEVINTTPCSPTDFKLVTPDHIVGFDSVGGDVTLPCHLSPETSAVAMEIRWFKGTDCIYLYNNGHVTEGRGYEGRVSMNTQELQSGYLSLRLSGTNETDKGVYRCQVIDGQCKLEISVGLVQGIVYVSLFQCYKEFSTVSHAID